MKFECSKWIYRRNKNTLVDIAEYLHHRSRDRYHLNLLGFFKSKMFKRASRRPLNNVDFFDILLLKVANKTKLFGTKIPKFPFKLINHPQFEESTRNHGQSFRGSLPSCFCKKVFQVSQNSTFWQILWIEEV